ncbi:MAG TPA: DNA mismatch repair endonuclease MutL [Eubacteriales bacterium]|nr:DNA mismatch repair endonuclease MutL [Eubacteriales bacterium]
MDKINVLTSEVYNKIAAGEVVERPASVVKELVENSIDANASEIVIEIEEGGIQRIFVYDNGSGMTKNDLVNAFLPHSTSKISSADDLASISTLGFRGEALASIASVSKINVVSKTELDDVGLSLNIIGGKIESKQPVSANTGTRIEVCDLFFNTPARKKFLKTPSREASEISNFVSRLILSNPKIKIKYILDGKTIYDFSGGGIEEAIFTVYGKECLDSCLAVESSAKNVKIYGYIGESNYSKANTTAQTVVINGRYVNCAIVSAALKNAYAPYLMTRQYPFYVLYVDLPYDEIDVNVHPNKLEVKFLYGQDVFMAAYLAAKDTLANATKQYKRNIEIKTEPINENKYANVSMFPPNNSQGAEYALELISARLNKDINKDNSKNINCDNDEINGNHGLNNIDENNPHIIQSASKAIKENSSAFEFDSKKGYDKTDKNAGNNGNNEYLRDISIAANIGFEKTKIERTANINGEIPLNQDFSEIDNRSRVEQPTRLVDGTAQQGIFSDAKFLGIVFDTYIMLERGDFLFIIDQHAAHERILYDIYLKQCATNTIAKQPLIAPYIFHVTDGENGYIQQNITNLSNGGFEIEEFGHNTYKLSVIPAAFLGMSLEKFVKEVLTNIRYFDMSTSKLTADLLARRACKAAVKAGDVLDRADVYSLLAELDHMENLKCPHGRPIVVVYSIVEFEKWFKRIV